MAEGQSLDLPPGVSPEDVISVRRGLPPGIEPSDVTGISKGWHEPQRPFGLPEPDVQPSHSLGQFKPTPEFAHTQAMAPAVADVTDESTGLAVQPKFGGKQVVQGAPVGSVIPDIIQPLVDVSQPAVEDLRYLSPEQRTGIPPQWPVPISTAPPDYGGPVGQAMGGAVSGLAKAQKGLADFALSPAGLAMTATGGAAAEALPMIPRIISSVFTADMAKQFPQQWENLKNSAEHYGETGDPGPLSEAVTDAASTGYFAYSMGRHAAGVPERAERRAAVEQAKQAPAGIREVLDRVRAQREALDQSVPARVAQSKATLEGLGELPPGIEPSDVISVTQETPIAKVLRKRGKKAAPPPVDVGEVPLDQVAGPTPEQMRPAEQPPPPEPGNAPPVVAGQGRRPAPVELPPEEPPQPVGPAGFVKDFADAWKQSGYQLRQEISDVGYARNGTDAEFTFRGKRYTAPVGDKVLLEDPNAEANRSFALKSLLDKSAREVPEAPQAAAPPPERPLEQEPSREPQPAPQVAPQGTTEGAPGVLQKAAERSAADREQRRKEEAERGFSFNEKTGPKPGEILHQFDELRGFREGDLVRVPRNKEVGEVRALTLVTKKGRAPWYRALVGFENKAGLATESGRAEPYEQFVDLDKLSKAPPDIKQVIAAKQKGKKPPPAVPDEFPAEEGPARTGVGYADYQRARDHAQKMANQTGREWGIAKAKPFGKTVFEVRGLPEASKRQGWELRAEVVKPEGAPRTVVEGGVEKKAGQSYYSKLYRVEDNPAKLMDALMRSSAYHDIYGGDLALDVREAAREGVIAGTRLENAKRAIDHFRDVADDVQAYHGKEAAEPFRHLEEDVRRRVEEAKAAGAAERAENERVFNERKSAQRAKEDADKRIAGEQVAGQIAGMKSYRDVEMRWHPSALRGVVFPLPEHAKKKGVGILAPPLRLKPEGTRGGFIDGHFTYDGAEWYTQGNFASKGVAPEMPEKVQGPPPDSMDKIVKKPKAKPAEIAGITLTHKEPSRGKKPGYNVVVESKDGRSVFDSSFVSRVMKDHPGAKLMLETGTKPGEGRLFLEENGKRVAVVMPLRADLVEGKIGAPAAAPAEKPDSGVRAHSALAGRPQLSVSAQALPAGEQLRPSEIVKKVEESFGKFGFLPVKTKHFAERALGITKVGPQVVRLKQANDIVTLAHELGHHVQESLFRLPVGKGTPYDAELKKLGAATSRPSYSAKEVQAEGTAEFMRHFLFDPDKARQMAPEYAKVFEAALNSRPDVKAAIEETQRQLRGFYAQDPVERVKAKIDFEGEGKEEAGTRTQRFLTRWVDDLQPLKDATRTMAGQQSLNLTDDAYALARLARGAPAKAEGFLKFGVKDRAGTQLAPALTEALKPVKGRLEDFAAYLTAARAAELKSRGLEPGIDMEDALATVKKLHSPEFAEAARKVYAYNDGMLKYALSEGVLSSDQYAKIKELNQFYVPFQRIMDAVGDQLSGTSKKMADRGSPFKKIRGSGRDIVNPLESIVRNTYTITDMVEKNRAMQALTKQAENTTGGGRYIERIPNPMEATQFNLSQLAGDIREALESDGIELPMNHNLDEALDSAVTVFTPSGFSREKGIVTVVRNGKREFYSVNEPALYDAITAIGTRNSQVVVNLLERPARLLRAGATLSLGFIGRNPIRDTFDATVNSRYGFRPAWDTLRGLAEYAKSGSHYQDFLNSGGGNSALVSGDRNSQRKMLHDLAGHKSFRDSIVLHPIELLRGLSEAMENATRLGEFMRAAEAEGRTAEGLARAGLAARDVTLDFARGGTSAREINRYTAFFNAGVQGHAKLAEVWKRNPVGATMRAVAAITVPSLVVAYLNRGNKEYAQIPDWEKNTYWHIPLGEGKGWLRIPKPHGVLGMAFGSGPEALLRHLVSKDPGALDRLFPDKDAAWAALIGLVPTAILPAIEAYANYDTYRKRAIVSPWDTNIDLPLQTSRYTSELAKFVGPKIGMAPAKFDHLINGYSGGLGTGAAKAIDLPARLLLQRQERPAPGPESLPGVSAFYRRQPGADAESIQRFYERLDELEGLKRSITLYKTAGEMQTGLARWKQAVAASPIHDPARELEVMRKGAKMLSQQREVANRIFGDPNMDPQTKRASLEKAYQRMVRIATASLPEWRRLLPLNPIPKAQDEKTPEAMLAAQ